MALACRCIIITHYFFFLGRLQHHHIRLFLIGLITACAMEQLPRCHQLHPGPACGEHEQCGTCGGHSFWLTYTERSLRPETGHSVHGCGQSIPLLPCWVFGYKNSEDRSVKSMCVLGTAKRYRIIIFSYGQHGGTDRQNSDRTLYLHNLHEQTNTTLFLKEKKKLIKIDS